MDAFRATRSGLYREVGGPDYGHQDVGCSPGGPQDRWSAQVGNILIGNEDFAPCLEIVYPPELEALCDCIVILTGAKRKEARMITPAGASPLAHGAAFLARQGDRIALGQAEYGLRTYLCLRPCKGLSAAGRQALLGRVKPPHSQLCAWADAEGRIRVTDGPEFAQWPGAEAFFTQPWRISDMSNMGLRLAPAGSPLPACEARNMISQPVSDGTIQMTPKGPIILMRDRQTIGGYPRVLNVIGPDIDLLAQHAPRQVARFKRVTIEQAREVVRQRGQDLDRLRKMFPP